MKRLIIILIFLQFSNIGFSQDYIPMASTSKFWIYTHIANEDTGTIDNGIMLGIGKDTIINDLEYKIVNKYYLGGSHPCMQPPCFVITYPFQASTPTPIGYIRDDSISKKVYYKAIFGSEFGCGTKEYLLYDFSLNVGDSLAACHFLSGGYEWNVPVGIVDSIGFENGRYTQYTMGKLYAGLSGVGVKRISEGIGFNRYGLFHDLFFPLYRFCEGTLEECNIEIVTSSKVLSDKPFLKIFPNPATSIIEMKSSKQINNYILYDLSGKKMSSVKHSKLVNLSSLDAGIYVLKVFFDDGIVTKRVVKINQ